MSFSNESTNITMFTEEDFKHYLKLKEEKENKANKQKVYNERRRVWMNLMIAKAKAADIDVTEAEIDEELKNIKKS